MLFRSKGNKGKAEEMLEIFREEIRARIIAKEKLPKESNELYAAFLERWLTVIRRDLKPTTFGNYQMMVNNVVIPYFKKKGIKTQALLPEDITRFYSERLSEVKSTTVHKYHTLFSRSLAYAVELGLIEQSPMDKVKRPKAERFVGKFLKESEVKELFDIVSGHKLELGVILGSYYGLRRSEVVGLRWESIDFERNTITIEHSVTVAEIDGKKQIFESDTVKTKSSYRTLPLVPQFRDKLLQMKEEQDYYRELCGNAYNTAEGKYVYVDRLGNRIRPDYLTAEFPKFLEKHGFRRMRYHDLRHSCASLLLANGITLKEIQEWLGHSHFAITANTYAHLDFSAKIAAANAMTWIKETSLGSGKTT